jgi:hypothetical protein
MIRALNFTMLAFTMTICFGLYQVTHAAQEREAQLHAVETDIADAKRSVGVLKAEFSLLAQPSKVEAMSARHLDLQPTAARQVAMQIGDIPLREENRPDSMIDAVLEGEVFYDPSAPVPARKPRSVRR